MLDLAPIKAREAKATPGEWKSWSVDPDIPDDRRVCQAEGDECICCVALMGDSDESGKWTAETVLRWVADADFIAHARTDIPALIAEVERLRELLRAEMEATQ